MIRKFKPGQLVSYFGKKHKVADSQYFSSLHDKMRKTSSFFDKMRKEEFGNFLLNQELKEKCSLCEDHHAAYTLLELGEGGKIVSQKSSVCEKTIK